jgi:polyisoprenoid-binding protein YceI
MIRKIVALVAGIVGFIAAQAQSYIPVDDSSKVSFTIKNLGINVKGSFTGLQGHITFDANHPESSSFDVYIDAASVNTGNNARDNHLREEVFLDVKNHPHIKFVSVKVEPAKKAGTFFMQGTLTIKGIALPLSFPFTVTPTADGYWLEGEFDTRRKPYRVGRTSTVSDKLTASLRVLVKKT